MTEAQGSCPDDVVWHASIRKIDGPLEPRQAHDIGGNQDAIDMGYGFVKHADI